MGDKVYMMTYREGKVFKFERKTLKVVEKFNMPQEMAEGWGLT